MITPLTKLIAENKWRPIAEAKPCEDYNPHSYLLRDKESFIYIGYSIDGMSWFESGSEVLRVFPTHFRPLPDDRLALVTEHYRAGVDAFISMFEPLAEKNGIYAAALEFAQGLQKRATVIAEGKE